MAHKTATDQVIDTTTTYAEGNEVVKSEQARSLEQTQKNKEEAIANIYEMAGKIKATNFFKTQAEFFNLLLLKKVKDSKEYRELFGLTWEQFCTQAGLNWRTIDRNLEDLKPFHYDFLQTFVNFSGITFNKIKYLGMNESVTVTENAITYNGETIPVDAEHADEIQSLLETLEENHRQEKEENNTLIRTKDRLLKAKEDTINKMEREIKRLEKEAPQSELTEEEQDAINLLAKAQTDFLTTISDIRKQIEPHRAPVIALRQYYYLLIVMQKITMEERLALQDAYAQAESVPWEITEDELPPTDVMIDNTPITSGKGMGKKVVSKMEERKAAKGKK